MSELHALPSRIDSDAASVERDLFALVLALVEPIRQLMERQAVRRMDELSDEQVEALGSVLMRRDEAMTELRERYGLSEADLNPPWTDVVSRSGARPRGPATASGRGRSGASAT
ncbi:MAG TPA: gas vesicle protein K [Jatrophihabitantaceae bacterium]|nr:gas vesicle protein K [Jatrophihabitantaceae bacterium]